MDYLSKDSKLERDIDPIVAPWSVLFLGAENDTTLNTEMACCPLEANRRMVTFDGSPDRLLGLMKCCCAYALSIQTSSVSAEKMLQSGAA